MNSIAAVVWISILSGQTSPGAAPPAKADLVSVVGCLEEGPADTWRLTRASDPIASTANAPSLKELSAAPRGGKNEFHLIGVRVFNLPAHRNHTVLVKGLHIKASPVSRLNITSVTMVAPSCEAAKAPGSLPVFALH